MRCHWNRKGCELSTPASQPRQKLAVIKENAKYSFVELGKFNTRVYTRRISNSFVGLHQSDTDRHSAAPAIGPGGDRGRGLYNYRKGAIRVAGENLNKKWV